MGARSVILWSSYSIKRRIPWKLVFGFSLVLSDLCAPVNENHRHVQSWHPTTTTSFPGINDNNNKH